GTAVLAHDLLLAPVTAHATQCDPGDAGLEQRRLDFGQAFGPNDSGDEFHNGEASPPWDTVSTESCIKCSKLVSDSNWLRTAYYMPLSPVCKSCREMDSPPSCRVSPVGGEAGSPQGRSGGAAPAHGGWSADRAGGHRHPGAGPPRRAWKSPSLRAATG